MAEKLLQTAETAVETAVKQERRQKEVQETKKVSLDNALAKLAKFGGFGFLESCVDGVQNMSPERATCINFDVDYTLKGESYTCTTLVIQSEKLIVGDGIEFENEWVYDK